MRQIADGEPYKMPATIDDPAILDEISEALKAHGVETAGRVEEAGGQ
jgi:propionyl-CoA synthetase